eukprot:15363494-Ditylum_brightwellii.AAC.1
MELPIGMDVPEGNPRAYMLKLNHLIYSLKQSSLKWFNLLLSALQKEGCDVKGRENPARPLLLHKDLDVAKQQQDWHYCSVVCMMSYLQGLSRLEIVMAVHQCTRFSNQPMLSHKRVVWQIDKYLSTTTDQGIVYRPDSSLGIQCYVGADFAGRWNKADAQNPSKLQIEVALSPTKAEYIALSSAMRDVIPFMNFLEELSGMFKLHMPKPDAHCK